MHQPSGIRLAIVVMLAAAAAACNSSSTEPPVLPGSYVAIAGDAHVLPMRIDPCTPATDPATWITGAEMTIYPGDSLSGVMHTKVIAPNGKVLGTGDYQMWDWFTRTNDTLYRVYHAGDPVVGVVKGSAVDIHVYWAYPPSLGGCPITYRQLKFSPG